MTGYRLPLYSEQFFWEVIIFLNVLEAGNKFDYCNKICKHNLFSISSVLYVKRTPYAKIMTTYVGEIVLFVPNR
jgi:hypothetical protein